MIDLAEKGETEACCLHTGHRDRQSFLIDPSPSTHRHTKMKTDRDLTRDKQN